MRTDEAIEFVKEVLENLKGDFDTEKRKRLLYDISYWSKSAGFWRGAYILELGETIEGVDELKEVNECIDSTVEKSKYISDKNQGTFLAKALEYRYSSARFWFDALQEIEVKKRGEKQMFEKETISHMATYLKVRIAEEQCKKRETTHLDSIEEFLEHHRKASSRLDAYESVLEELLDFYGQETG